MRGRVLSICQKRYKRTTVLTVGFVAVLVGLALGRLRYEVPLGAVLTLVAIAAARFPKRNAIALIAVAAFGLSMGAYRGVEFMKTMHPYGNLYGERVVIEATAQEDAVWHHTFQTAAYRKP